MKSHILLIQLEQSFVYVLVVVAKLIRTADRLEVTDLFLSPKHAGGSSELNKYQRR